MDNIRFVLIIALSFISIMLYQAWQIDYGPKPEIENIVSIENAPIEDLPETQNVEKETVIKTETEQPLSTMTVVEEVQSEIVTVTTDVFQLDIDTKGGNLTNLDLLQYPIEKVNSAVDKLRDMVGFPAAELNLNPIRLFDSRTDHLFLAQSGLMSSSDSAALANHHTVFNAQERAYQLQPGEDILRVPFTWIDTSGIQVTKTFVFTRGSYLIQVEQKISNQSDNDWKGRQYSQFLRIPYEDDKGNTFIRTYAGGVVYTQEEKYQKIDFSDMAEENFYAETLGGWSAMVQHYFAAAWVPPAEEINHYYTKELKDWRYVIGSYSSSATVPVNSEHVFNTQLYVGPKIQPKMEIIATGLELTVDYGWLTIIGKPIYWLLNKIHDYVGNWGWSILGVTLCVKILFFKLTEISYKSMAKMRKIQPKLADLKARFGDDRQRFNTEMMDLYKKEKVNPMGGCFPMLVQIPVFISLYWVLIETVELRLAPFEFWIQDLSAKDPFFLLPILMGITMKIQQSLNPAPVDPIQAKVMKMFPLVFTVFFLFFPAGLVLYWVMNNTLSAIQQYVITKNIEKQD
jgi:YidC/Oxa1 family membrane protein insertase